MVKTIWRYVFLGLTALVLGMEVMAATDGNPNTEPWTDLITQYVPAEVFWLGFGGLTVWLTVHFVRRRFRR